jgi:unsaturated pyranuronate lyase
MSYLDLNSVEEIEIVPGYFAKFIHSKNMTIAYWNIKAGSALPAHSHLHEQISLVLSGEFELTVDGKPFLMKADHSYSIPANVPHSGKANTDCKIVDTFYPIRDDYKK